MDTFRIRRGGRGDHADHRVTGHAPRTDHETRPGRWRSVGTVPVVDPIRHTLSASGARTGSRCGTRTVKRIVRVHSQWTSSGFGGTLWGYLTTVLIIASQVCDPRRTCERLRAKEPIRARHSPGVESLSETAHLRNPHDESKLTSSNPQ